MLFLIMHLESTHIAMVLGAEVLTKYGREMYLFLHIFLHILLRLQSMCLHKRKSSFLKSKFAEVFFLIKDRFHEHTHIQVQMNQEHPRMLNSKMSVTFKDQDFFLCNH